MSAHSSLRQQIRQWLIKDGWMITAGRETADADIIGCVAGRWLSLEIKTGKGRPTKYQAMKIRRIRQAGGYGWIVRTAAQAVRAVELVKQGVPSMPDDELGLEDVIQAPVDKPAPAVADVGGPVAKINVGYAQSVGIVEQLVVEIRRCTDALLSVNATLAGLGDGLHPGVVESSPEYVEIDPVERVVSAALTPEQTVQPRRRGRPAGSKNKPKDAEPDSEPTLDVSPVDDGPQTIDDLDLENIANLPGLTPENPIQVPESAGEASDDDLGDFKDLLEGL